MKGLYNCILSAYLSCSKTFWSPPKHLLLEICLSAILLLWVRMNPIHSKGISSLKTLTQNYSQIYYLNTTVFTLTGVLATLVSRKCQYFGMSFVRFVVVTVVNCLTFFQDRS